MNTSKASPEQVVERVVVFAQGVTLHRGNMIIRIKNTFAGNWCTGAGTGRAVTDPIHMKDFTHGILLCSQFDTILLEHLGH
jgi:hypothetical protein